MLGSLPGNWMLCNNPESFHKSEEKSLNMWQVDPKTLRLVFSAFLNLLDQPISWCVLDMYFCNCNFGFYFSNKGNNTHKGQQQFIIVKTLI